MCFNKLLASTAKDSRSNNLLRRSRSIIRVSRSVCEFPRHKQQKCNDDLNSAEVSYMVLVTRIPHKPSFHCRFTRHQQGSSCHSTCSCTYVKDGSYGGHGTGRSCQAGSQRSFHRDDSQDHLQEQHSYRSQWRTQCHSVGPVHPQAGCWLLCKGISLPGGLSL